MRGVFQALRVQNRKLEAQLQQARAANIKRRALVAEEAHKKRSGSRSRRNSVDDAAREKEPEASSRLARGDKELEAARAEARSMSQSIKALEARLEEATRRNLELEQHPAAKGPQEEPALGPSVLMYEVGQKAQPPAADVAAAVDLARHMERIHEFERHVVGLGQAS